MVKMEEIPEVINTWATVLKSPQNMEAAIESVGMWNTDFQIWIHLSLKFTHIKVLKEVLVEIFKVKQYACPLC